jgi:hypothetical protein
MGQSLPSILYRLSAAVIRNMFGKLIILIAKAKSKIRNDRHFSRIRKRPHLGFQRRKI